MGVSKGCVWPISALKFARLQRWEEKHVSQVGRIHCSSSSASLERWTLAVKSHCWAWSHSPALRRSARVRGKDVGWPQPTCHESKYFVSQHTAPSPFQAFCCFHRYVDHTVSAFFFQWVHFAVTYRWPFYLRTNTKIFCLGWGNSGALCGGAFLGSCWDESKRLWCCTARLVNQWACKEIWRLIGKCVVNAIKNYLGLQKAACSTV